ncbi:hypothetical protein CXG81DRAFT_11566 [Caulochytrium protostelioides]|uniref:GOLD domain-containing protein n=1 Tax=Caulochytrium protostelioides TaxID=1555241 RepID=A0A4P9X907_9FUNG|nr:hypothetical protein CAUPRSCDRAFT_10656 [Caulochytrium protostelioides]RKP01776.1 hypothetical protein CXG81DRAFT_11566 [Caulochytrium protostelioides]|eukprot:RKP01776.1 hypothetical protein CXG81DRAFT_11566 [Caulochytrium protostelioides]
MLPTLLLLVAIMAARVQAIYFYLEADQQRCFFEELPAQTTVIASHQAEMLRESDWTWVPATDIGIRARVETVPARVPIIEQHSEPQGRITFTTTTAGDHEICLQVSGRLRPGPNGAPARIRLHFDLLFGDAGHDPTAGKREAIDAVVRQISNLQTRMTQIRTEQQTLREREVDFRNLSERVNGHVVWYSLLQFFALAAAVTWQVRQLRGFFVAKKLV